MKKKAEKFIYADWHGFSYLLDSALDIFGKAFTLAGIIAIVATLNGEDEDALTEQANAVAAITKPERGFPWKA